MAYTDAATVRALLGITSTDDDTLIGVLAARAQAYIDVYCNRTFEASADSTRYFVVGQDTDGLTLTFDKEIAAFTSVTNGDGVAVASGSYTTKPRNDAPYYAIKLNANSGVAWAYTDDPDEDAIAVVGKWAYSTSAPADIVWAATRLTAWLYRQKDTGNDPNLDRPILTGTGAVVLPMGLPQDVKALLQAYKSYL